MAGTTRPVFGVLLRRFRRNANLTQEELAGLIGYSTVYVGMLERGQRRPRLSTVAVLADALALGPYERDLLLTAARHQESGAAERTLALAVGAVPPLFGRAREVEVLEQHLKTHGPVTLLLVGEPGIGKTRLLREAEWRAAAGGWQVLMGGCQRRGGQEPYAPLAMAVEGYVGQQEPDRLRAQLQGCGWLVRLLPELAEVLEPLPAWTLPAEQERRQVARALKCFLQNVAGSAGTLLLLDDLQWAGPDALALLASLAPAAPDAALRIVGAYRDTEVTPPLSGLLADLTHEGLVAHQALAPLAPEEAARLLDCLLAGRGAGPAGAVDRGSARTSEPVTRTRVLERVDGPVTRARVLERAGGVPFALVSYAHALQAGTDGAGTGVPWDLAQSVRQRVAALPAGARAVLDTLAVMGREAPRALLLAVLAGSEGEMLEGLGAACRARLLEEGTEHYHFAHDVIREVVEGDLGLARRLALHRRVARALERAPGEPAVALLAYHYGQGGMPEKATGYLEMAGERAQAQGAHAAAEDYYREAAAALDELGQAVEAARVRETLAGLLVTLGRYHEALAVLGRAEQGYREAGDGDGEARTVAHSGTVHGYQATPEEALPRVQATIRRLEEGGQEGPSPALAKLYGALHILFEASRARREQLAAAVRAAEVGQAVGDVKNVIRATRSQGTALLALGRLDEARRVLEGVLPLANTMGDVYVLCSVLDTLAQAYMAVGDLERSRTYWEQALDIAQRTGDRVDMAFDASGLGLALFYLGDWPAARVHLERASGIMGAVGSSWVASSVDLSLARLSLAEGAWEQAVPSLEKAIAGAAARRDVQALARAHSLRAEWDLVGGEARLALKRLEPFLDVEGPAMPWVLSAAAWSYLDLGEATRADELAARAVASADRYDRLALVEALRVRGSALARLGQHDEAALALAGALARARAMRYPYGEGRVLYTMALAQLERSERPRAQEQLEEALAIFRRLGARVEMARAEEALACLQTAWRRRADVQVSDDQWARIQALLPPPARTGRPRADDRRTLEAILYVQRTRCAWAALPLELGDDATARRRLRQWRAAGLWERIAAILRGASFP